MANFIGHVKRATIAALKAAAPLEGVPAARVYPPQRPAQPVWPFVGYGVGSATPFGASCLDGSDITVAVHAYATTTGTGGLTVGGEDGAQAIVDAIEAVLAGATLELGGDRPATAHYTVTATQVIQDGTEADAFHGIVSLRIVVSS